MFLKELINKSVFDLDGYVLLDTSLSKNQTFNSFVVEVQQVESGTLRTINWGDIKNVEFGIGDIHHHGETATSIIFYDGGHYIYKPRSLELEIEFGRIWTQNLILEC